MVAKTRKTANITTPDKLADKNKNNPEIGCSTTDQRIIPPIGGG